MLHEQGGGAEGEATRQENRPYPVGKVILALDDDGMKDADDDEGGQPDEDSRPVEYALTPFSGASPSILDTKEPVMGHGVPCQTHADRSAGPSGGHGGAIGAAQVLGEVVPTAAAIRRSGSPS